MTVVLAGDIGGTHTRLALFSTESRQLERLETYSSADYPSLEEIFDEFLAKHGAEPAAATVGVAGPVRNGRTDAVNLHWSVDTDRLAANLGLDRQ